MARWLEGMQSGMSNVGWPDFCAALQGHFGRNQHETLRKLFRIAQTDIVEDYVERYVELHDQLSI